jgi:hypothetical protein
MYLSDYKIAKKPVLQSAQNQRTLELAELLLNALGYEDALVKARESHWDNVADTIRFMASKSCRRF